MKVKFIGTGSMISSDNPASYLINNKIMIDMPNGIVKILKKKDLFNSVQHIFITHIHGDHIFDLPFIFLDRVKEDKELYVYISKKWLGKIKQLVKLAFPRQYYAIFYTSKIKFVTDGNILIDDLIINRFEVSHGAMKPSFGYTVVDKKYTVTFTGDTSLCDSVIKKANQSDYLICDCTLSKGNDKHMGVDNIIYLLELYPNLKIIPSHMGINSKNELRKVQINNLLLKEDYEELDCD